MIANVSADVLTAFVDSHLGDGETAHTDGWRGYAQLGKTGYRHIVSVLSKLDQTAAEVLPRVHLIFSLLKRKRSVVSWLWQPNKRVPKAVFDIGTSLLSVVTDSTKAPEMIPFSLPYLIFLNAVSSIPKSPFTVSRQICAG